MLGLGISFTPFGTGKHNFGYIPDPPEPDDEECNGEYVEGSCECCDCFEECLKDWERGADERQGIS